MREILFRGKRVDNGEWVYGGIVHQTDFYGDKVDNYFIIDGTTTEDYDIGYSYEVIPETIGQYIGVKDKYGFMIFEGDVVKGSWDKEIEILYNEYALCFEAREIGSTITHPIDYYGGTHYEGKYDKLNVVGTIHDKEISNV